MIIVGLPINTITILIYRFWDYNIMTSQNQVHQSKHKCQKKNKKHKAPKDDQSFRFDKILEPLNTRMIIIITWNPNH